MPKGYWIVFYRKVMDAARLSEYAALAGPAIEAGGGRFRPGNAGDHLRRGGGSEKHTLPEGNASSMRYPKREPPPELSPTAAHRAARPRKGEGDFMRRTCSRHPGRSAESSVRLPARPTVRPTAEARSRC